MSIVYASSFIVLHSTGSSLQNRIRTFSHALLFDNIQFLGEEFSERFFFYSLMKRCFGLNYVNYSGEELEKAIGKGMPDYYLRYRNRVFVFGCKDVQMAAKIKLSGDYETIKNIFWEVCHKFQGACERGWQLANMIGKKMPSILSEVDKWTANGVKFIYPW